MGNVGSAANGKTLIASGLGASPTFVSIGTNSGLTAHGVVIAEGNGAFVSSVGTTGQVLTGVTGSDPVWASPAVAPLGLTSATITLTSAQIKALHATPITIIPAQGVGTMIITVGITGQYTYGGSNVFVAAAGQFVSASYNTLQGIGTMLPNSALIAAASQDGIVGMPNISTLSVRNQPIVAYNSNATEISGNAANDNTLKITVLYYVVT